MIGERIKERREAINLSQDELAKKLGYKSRENSRKKVVKKYETIGLL